MLGIGRGPPWCGSGPAAGRRRRARRGLARRDEAVFYGDVVGNRTSMGDGSTQPSGEVKPALMAPGNAYGHTQGQ